MGQELGGLRGALGRETGRHRGDVLRGIGVRTRAHARHDLRGQRLRIRLGQGLPLGLLSVRRLLAVLALLFVLAPLAVLALLLLVLALLLVVLAAVVLPL